MTYQQWTHDQDHETYAEYLPDTIDDADDFASVYGREFPGLAASTDDVDVAS